MIVKENAPPIISIPDGLEALSILFEASFAILRAESEAVLLSHTLEVANNLLGADAYQVLRPTNDRSTWQVIATHGTSDHCPMTLHFDRGDLSQDVCAIQDLANDERFGSQKAFYEREGIRSALIVFWILGSTTHGAIICYWRRPHRVVTHELSYALALANLSLSTLHRLDLSESKIREKQRSGFLADASVMLASSLDYETTIKRVAHLAVSLIAEWCTVHVAEDGKLARLIVAHADPEMAGVADEYERRYPERVVSHQGVGKVFATGEPEIVPVITHEMLRAAAQDEDHLQLLMQLNLSSSIVVPLRSRERVLGAIRLLGTNGHYFGEGDVQLAIGLGQRAAAAIENAQLHHALLERDSELRLSHAAAKMGSWSWDLVQDRLFWSPEFKSLHGLPEDAEATPQAGYDLVHPADREQSQREFLTTLESTVSVFNSEHRSIHSDGRVLWLQVRGRIRRNADGKATWIAGLIIDVTESRIAEQALRRAEKLVAAGRLAATVAHEVNNPLEALMNTVYLAQRTEGLTPEVADHLHVADSELRRIAHIVKQTLGFYRESVHPQPTALLRLVNEVMDLYSSRSLRRGVALRVSSQSHDEIVVTVIAGEIRQVLANLIANAIDATPVGGIVEISCTRLEDAVEIVVSDTGCGISEANRKHLFEPFFTRACFINTSAV